MSDGVAHCLFVNVLPFEVSHHDFFVDVGEYFEKLSAVFLCFALHVRRNVNGLVTRAQVLSLPDDCFHGNEVNNTYEVSFVPYWKLQYRDVCFKTINDAGQRVVERRAGSVQFVNETHPRDAVFVGLSPNGFRLRFDTRDSVKDSNGAVKNSERSFNFDGEVNVSGGVNDVDDVVVPQAGGGCRGDRDTALLFLFHPVHGRGAVVNLTDFVVDACVIQDALCCGRFPSINVSHDADVSHAVKRLIAWHENSALVSRGSGGRGWCKD